MTPDKTQYISVALIWFERFQEASRMINTEYEANAIWKFYHSLLNLGEGKMAIKDKVTTYLNDIWYPKVDMEYKSIVTEYIGETDMMLRVRKEAEHKYIKDLFAYIIQTIQDSGIGWPTKQELQSFTYVQE